MLTGTDFSFLLSFSLSFLCLFPFLAPAPSIESSSSAQLSTGLSTTICMAWILIAASTVLVWITWTAVSLFANFRIARQVGLPVIISPVGALDPLWILANRCLPILSSLKWLPFGWGTFARCTTAGWQFKEKYALHQQFGDAFMLVTPTTNELVLADPDAASEVLARRKDFTKPAVIYSTSDPPSLPTAGSDSIPLEQLDIFGPNLNTVRLYPSAKYVRTRLLIAQLRLKEIPGNAIGRLPRHPSMNELAALYGVKLSNKPTTCCNVGYSEAMRGPKRLLAILQCWHSMFSLTPVLALNTSIQTAYSILSQVSACLIEMLFQ